MSAAHAVADRLDLYLAGEPHADPTEAGRLLGRLGSALEWLLAELLAEQHGIDEAFDGFTAAPGLDTGRGVTADGVLEMTGAAYLFGPPYSLWPFHGKLAPHPRESILCLSSRDAIVPMSELPVRAGGSRRARGSLRRENQKKRSRGDNLRVPPDPLSWPYVMTTALPAVQSR